LIQESLDGFTHNNCFPNRDNIRDLKDMAVSLNLP